MGMEAVYRRIRPERFTRMLVTAQAAPSYLLNIDLFYALECSRAEWKAEAGEDAEFELGKHWHALHFLLTGNRSLEEPCPVPPPLGLVVLGGTTTPIATGYGAVRYLTPAEVQLVAKVLSELTVTELARRFDPAAFNAAEFYGASRGAWDEERLESVLELYPELVKFFADAAQAGDVVLLSLE